ncbi:MAG: transketolase family protein [Dehalococcoidia bacterium]|nr:transketolase family protein [Dehalococcoidia bacterium]MDW8120630.1 transketolase C-terminal domain-containing protein [Chloroflexota bacterium]
MSRWTLASTREAYGKALVDLGREDSRIVVLGADLNKSTQTVHFAKAFPERFFDLGAAEANMMSIAAGLAASGKIPFCSTFTVFGVCRAYDQLRISIAQPALNVKVVCSHAGIITGEDGMSAHGIEDLALMLALPTFTVVAPCDAPETMAAVRAIAQHPGPCYMRVYRPATPVVHTNGCSFTLGKAEHLRPGRDATIIACGSMVPWALEAAATLATQGVDCRVLNMHTLRPLDTEAIVQSARQTGALVTAEEHLVYGGLGALVAQTLARTYPVPLEMVALTGYAESGAPQDLLEKYGLAPRYIVDAVHRVLRRKG